MNTRDEESIRETVRKAYGGIARGDSTCGCGCGPSPSQDIARLIGYTDEELGKAPKESNLGLGCGNPTAIAELSEGETVLDLGSGAGFDCFLAAGRVGPRGRVIGIDMTPEMIAKATANAAAGDFTNVEFRQGTIEELPVADDSVDAVISNCVINLSADKPKVFSEIVRVLKPGGRVAISDMALLEELPASIKASMAAYVGCVAGAVTLEEYKQLVDDAGLEDVTIDTKGFSSCLDAGTADPVTRSIIEAVGIEELAARVVSIYVTGRK